MKFYKKKNCKKTFLMVIVFAINLLLSGTAKSYGQFNVSDSAKLTTKVASGDDIIKNVYLDSLENPTKINIVKAENCKSNPIIYFEVTGRLAYYVQHINPIELKDNNKVYEVPINIKINNTESNNFLSNKTNDVEGEIIIRYLDNYINKSIKNIKFTKEYLEDVYKRKLSTPTYSNSNNEKDIDRIKSIQLLGPELANANPAKIANPYSVRITVNNNPNEVNKEYLNNNLIVYFELTGNLPYFVEHLNPVEINRNKDRYDIPIYIKANYTDFKNGFPTVEGNIIVKYLNSSYSQTIHIKYPSMNIQDIMLDGTRDVSK